MTKENQDEIICKLFRTYTRMQLTQKMGIRIIKQLYCMINSRDEVDEMFDDLSIYFLAKKGLKSIADVVNDQGHLLGFNDMRCRYSLGSHHHVIIKSHCSYFP